MEKQNNNNGEVKHPEKVINIHDIDPDSDRDAALTTEDFAEALSEDEDPAAHPSMKAEPEAQDDKDSGLQVADEK